jgi:hypothetical protein
MIAPHFGSPVGLSAKNVVYPSELPGHEGYGVPFESESQRANVI